MKLSEYLKSKGIRVAEFAFKLGVTRASVYSYLNGKKIPSEENMKLIASLTDNQVLPNDFYKFLGNRRRRVTTAVSAELQQT